MASSSRFFTSFFLKVTFFPKPQTKICTIKFNSECSTWSLILFPDLKQYSSVSSTSVYFLVIWTNPRFCSNIGLVSFFGIGFLFLLTIPELDSFFSYLLAFYSPQLSLNGIERYRWSQQIYQESYVEPEPFFKMWRIHLMMVIQNIF